MSDLEFFKDLCQNKKVPDTDVRAALCELWNAVADINIACRAVAIMRAHRPGLFL